MTEKAQLRVSRNVVLQAVLIPLAKVGLVRCMGRSHGAKGSTRYGMFQFDQVLCARCSCFRYLSWKVLLAALARPAPREKGHFGCRMRPSIYCCWPNPELPGLFQPGIFFCRQNSDYVHSVLSFPLVSRRYCLRCVMFGMIRHLAENLYITISYYRHVYRSFEFHHWAVCICCHHPVGVEEEEEGAVDQAHDSISWIRQIFVSHTWSKTGDQTC